MMMMDSFYNAQMQRLLFRYGGSQYGGLWRSQDSILAHVSCGIVLYFGRFIAVTRASYVVYCWIPQRDLVGSRSDF